MTETPEERAFRLAEHTYQGVDAAIARSFEAQTAFAVATLQIASVAAGGIAAVLAFFTAHWERLSMEAEAVENVRNVLVCMFASLIVSIRTGVVAYLSQSAFTAAAASREKVSDHPWQRDTPNSVKYGRLGTRLEYTALSLGILSIVLLCVGATFFARIVFH